MRLSYATFKAILEAQSKQHEVDRKINDVLRLAQSDTYYMGTTIDEIGQAFDMVFHDAYREEGKDLIDWWLYEDVEKFLYAAGSTGTENKEIVADLTTMLSLWQYLEKNYEL